MKRLGIKKIIGIFIIVFFVSLGMTFGQTECPEGQVYNTTINRCSLPEVEVTAENCNGGKIIAGFCKCPDGHKNIKGTCKPCSDPGVCCGVELNTNVPFIGNCIELSSDKSCTDSSECPGGFCVFKNDDDATGTCQAGNDSNEAVVTDKTAFPILMGGLTKILMTVIILMSFVMILVGGVMISASGGSDTGASNGKKIIGKVIIGLALLGASGVILRLINPNFFG